MADIPVPALAEEPWRPSPGSHGCRQRFRPPASIPRRGRASRHSLAQRCDRSLPFHSRRAAIREQSPTDALVPMPRLCPTAAPIPLVALPLLGARTGSNPNDPALWREVEIIRTRFGVPHICAETLAGAGSTPPVCAHARTTLRPQPATAPCRDGSARASRGSWFREEHV
jgi:hypothetical protein